MYPKLLDVYPQCDLAVDHDYAPDASDVAGQFVGHDLRDWHLERDQLGHLRDPADQ